MAYADRPTNPAPIERYEPVELPVSVARLETPPSGHCVVWVYKDGRALGCFRADSEGLAILICRALSQSVPDLD